MTVTLYSRWPRVARRLTAALSVAGLALVAGFSADTAGAEAATTIRFVASTTTRAGFEAEVKQFEAANPTIAVNAQYLPIEQVQTQITTQLAAGTGPDVFITNPGVGILGVQRLGAAGLLAPLDDSAWKATVPAANLALIQSGGKTYGYPTSEVLYFVLYNAKAYADLGLEVPTTLAEFEAVCAKARQNGKSALAIPGSATNLLALTSTQIAVNTVYSSEPDWNDRKIAGSTTFADSPGWKQMAEAFMGMKKAGCFQDGAEAATFPDVVKAITSGQALGLISFSTQVGQIIGGAPDLKFGAFPLPGVTADQTRLPVSTSVTVSINANSKEAAAAEKFVAFLAEPDQASAYAKAQGDVALVDAAKGVLPDHLAGLEPLLKAGRTVPLPIFVWPSGAYAALGKNAQGVLTGQIDPEAWLSDLDRGWAR